MEKESFDSSFRIRVGTITISNSQFNISILYSRLFHEYPILAALYASFHLVSNRVELPCFMVKTMNRTVLDGMLGFTGGVSGCGQFLSLLAPAIEMTGGEGFAKVIPAAVFSWCALYFRNR
jgi:zinc transporter ZupT